MALPHSETRSAPARPPAIGPQTAWRIAAYLLVVLFALVNVLYLILDCPHDLAPDEAHYWDWSRNLDWSYYSKGPLVAWLIRFGYELFGPLATQLTGTAMPAVRLPAVLANALMLLAVHQLCRQTFGSERLGLATVALALTIPPFAAPAVMITIDMPYLCCWAWACVFAQRAVTGGGLGWWAATGAVTAVGILAKYNMVVFPASVGLFLLTSRSRRAELLRPGVWVMGLVSLLGLVPIVIWNASHDWMGFKHVFALTGFFAEHTAVKQDRGIDPTALPHFLGGQFALLLGYWFVAWVAAMIVFRPWKVPDPRTALLWWVSLPIWAIFFIAGIKSKGQLNWPAAAYISGFVLTMAWVARQVSGPAGGYRTLARVCLALVVGLGVTTTLLLRYPGPMRAVLAEFAPTPTTAKPIPVRKFDPTGRLAGWRELAARVDEARERVRAEEGVEPLVAAMVWHQPGELGFYCRGNPTVYSFGPAIADRYSQYDVWRPNPIADAQVFQGRTFVYVGDYNPSLEMAFDRMDGPVEVIASDGTVPVSEWKLWVLRGFKGFPGRQGKGY